MSNTQNMEPMAIWNPASVTDPAYTKPVKLGRNFTAIDPTYQSMRMTELFGPACIAWGFEVMETVFLPTDQVAVKVRLRLQDGEQFVEQFGQSGLYIDKANTKPDGDCMKKATTDGLTKCMSYLGLNADVFLGKFDDSKYVAELKAQFSKDAPPALTADAPPLDKSEATVTERDWPHWVKDQIAGFAEYKTLDDLKFWQSTQAATLTELQQSNPGLHDQVRASFKARKLEVNPNG